MEALGGAAAYGAAALRLARCAVEWTTAAGDGVRVWDRAAVRLDACEVRHSLSRSLSFSLSLSLSLSFSLSLCLSVSLSLSLPSPSPSLSRALALALDCERSDHL